MQGRRRKGNLIATDKKHVFYNGRRQAVGVGELGVAVDQQIAPDAVEVAEAVHVGEVGVAGDLQIAPDAGEVAKAVHVGEVGVAVDQQKASDAGEVAEAVHAGKVGDVGELHASQQPAVERKLVHGPVHKRCPLHSQIAGKC